MQILQVFGGLIFLAMIGWVTYDSARLDWSRNRFCNAQWKWIVGLVFLWPVTFPLYLWQRRKVRRISIRLAKAQARVAFPPVQVRQGQSSPANRAPGGPVDLFSSPG